MSGVGLSGIHPPCCMKKLSFTCGLGTDDKPSDSEEDSSVKLQCIQYCTRSGSVHIVIPNGYSTSRDPTLVTDSDSEDDGGSVDMGSGLWTCSSK